MQQYTVNYPFVKLPTVLSSWCSVSDKRQFNAVQKCKSITLLNCFRNGINEARGYIIMAYFYVTYDKLFSRYFTLRHWPIEIFLRHYFS